MKKHLLLTTALLVTISTTHNVSAIEYSGNLNISDGNYTKSNLPEGFKDYDDDHQLEAINYNSIAISGGKLTLNDFKIRSGRDALITGGTVNVSNGGLKAHEGELNISGGTITITNESEVNGGITNVSGAAVINVSGGSSLVGDTNLNISQGTINVTNGYVATDGGSSIVNMSGGIINMRGGAAIASKMDSNTSLYEAGYIKMEGGTINVSGNNNIFLTQISDIKNTINIEKGSTLSVFNQYDKSGGKTGIDRFVNKGDLNILTDNFNLGGTLNSNVNNTGKMNITSTSAKLNGNLNVNNNGLIDLTENKLTVGGDVAFNSGSTLQTILTNKNSFGSLKANTIKISDDNTTLKMAFNGGVVAKNETIKLKILDTNTLDGTFSNQPENARYDIKYIGNGVYEITGLEDTGDIIDDGGNSGDQQTENMKSVGEAWDSLVTDENSSQTTVAVAEKLAELSNSTSTEDKKAYKDALVALAPETAPAVEASQMQISNQVFNAVGTRMSGGSYSGYQRGMSSGDGYSDTAIWVQGMLNKAKYDKSKETEFDSDTWGTAIGLEKQFNYATKLGLGYAYSKSDIDGFNRKTDVNTHTALVYGEVKPNNWFANVIASYGWSDYEEKKNVAGVNVKADYDVETLGLQAMTGYDIHSRTTGVTLTPEAGVRYLHIKNKEYTDSAGQKTKNEDSDVLTGVLGIGLSKNYRIIYTNIRVKPEARVAMTYDFQQDDTKSTVTLPNNAVYSVTGKPLNRYGVEIGAGFTADFYDTMELSLGYEGKFREDYQDHTGLVNAKYKF